jgi:hypothetical protein
MDFIQTHWVEIAAAVLALLRVLESYMVEKKNTTAVTIIGVIKQFFKVG